MDYLHFYTASNTAHKSTAERLDVLLKKLSTLLSLTLWPWQSIPRIQSLVGA
jgi:hypothetical protein